MIPNTEQFYGMMETFRTTAGSDIEANARVAVGGLVGYTRQAYASGDIVVAHFSAPVSVYVFELAATNLTISQGAKVYITSEGKVTGSASSNTLIGLAYSAVASGDTHAAVAVYGLDGGSTAEAGRTAANVAALTDSTGGTAATSLVAPAGDAYTTAELEANFASLNTNIKATLTALKNAGLMAADAT